MWSGDEEEEEDDLARTPKTGLDIYTNIWQVLVKSVKITC